MDYTYQIRLRRGTSSQWSISNPILASGEPGLATDLNYYKIGDGVTPWNDLPWTTGLKGDSASVTAGETITGAPGSSADVTNSGTELNAIFDFVIPEGMPGKDLVVHEGDRDDPPSDWTNQQFLWDPNGEIHEEVPLTEAETDARYISKSLLTAKGDLMARDASTTVRVPVGQDGQLLTADSSALQGMAWKPNEAYSKAVSDARYEKKLLTQAVAWYDAGVLTDDGTALRDLSGNGRPAVFGEGAAAPLVLPYDGEPYVHLPHADDSGYISASPHLSSQPRGKVVVTMRFRNFRTTSNNGLFTYGNSYHGFTVSRVADGRVVYYSMNAGGVADAIISTDLMDDDVEWHRFTKEGLTVTYESSPDGSVWTVGHTLSFNAGFEATAANMLLFGHGAMYANGTGMDLYYASLKEDGALTYELRPSAVDKSTYVTIANTGTAGGYWVVNRLTSGFKAAVVDRPLVLFGNRTGMSLPTKFEPSADFIALVAVREFGPVAPGAYCRAWLDTGSAGTLAPGFYLYSLETPEVWNVYMKDGARMWSAPLVQIQSGQHVLGAVKRGKSLGLSVDGVVRTTTEDSIPHMLEHNTVLTIGGYNGDIFNEYMNGEFIGAAIFDRALTDAEVAQASAELLGTPHYAQADPHPQYVLESQVGNMLTANQARPTEGVFGGTVETITYHGDGSITVQNEDGNNLVSFRFRNDLWPVQGGAVYTVGHRILAWEQMGAAYFVIQYFDKDNNVLIDATSPTAVPRAGDYLIHTARAPEQAAFVRVWFQHRSLGNNVGSCRLSDFGLWRGAGGDWAMPGIPIVNQGVRTSRPNVDDRLVETWDGSKWVATYYDTGLRDVRSLLVNGWTANIATLLRIGRKVTMVVYLDPTAATSDIFFVPPVGFEPVQLGVSAPGVGSATSVNLIEVSGQQLRSVFHTATQVYYCRIDWETAPTVPTSLPGTLIIPAE